MQLPALSPLPPLLYQLQLQPLRPPLLVGLLALLVPMTQALALVAVLQLLLRSRLLLGNDTQMLPQVGAKSTANASTGGGVGVGGRK